jgi:hypothetical protein
MYIYVYIHIYLGERYSNTDSTSILIYINKHLRTYCEKVVFINLYRYSYTCFNVCIDLFTYMEGYMHIYILYV